MKCLNLFLLKQIIKTQLFYFIMFIYVSIVSKLWYTVSQQVYQGIYHGKLIDTLVMSQVWI